MTALDLSMASVKPSKRVKGPYRVVALKNPHSDTRPCGSLEELEDAFNTFPHEWTLISANVQAQMMAQEMDMGNGKKVQVAGAVMFGGTAVFRVPEEKSE